MLLYVPQIVGTQTQPSTRRSATWDAAAAATARDASSCSAGSTDSSLMLTRIDAGGQLIDQIVVEVVIRQMAVW